MGYRDDFYIAEHMIGYTGHLSCGVSTLSIYFYERISGAFGAITQSHYQPNNIGRNPVATFRDYLIFNTKEGLPVVQSFTMLGVAPKKLSQEQMSDINKICQEQNNNVMVEFYGSCVQHISRNPFVSIRYRASDLRTALYQSVSKVADLKALYEDGQIFSPLNRFA